MGDMAEYFSDRVDEANDDYGNLHDNKICPKCKKVYVERASETHCWRCGTKYN